MKEMSSYTHVGPNERFQQLNEFLNDIQKREEGRKELSKWQINLDKELVQLTGRTMKAESIIYKDRTIKYDPLEADRSRDGRSLAHLSAKNLDKWILIYSQRHSQIAYSFVDSLNKVCTSFGMRVDFSEMIELPNDRSKTFIRAIENKANPQLDLVCCILTNNRKDRYDAIKKRQLMSVATKVGIEINAKLGGEIWAVQIPSKTLMFIGIDTNRDSQSRSSQMVGFVASINPTCTRYYPRVIEQRSTNDFISGLKSCMQNALQKYHHINGVLPAKIIVYRDGVNDLQLLDVIENELPALNEICMKAQEGYEDKKRSTAASSSSMTLITLFNDLPDLALIEIFSYLSSLDILWAFSSLNQRISLLLVERGYFRCINLSSTRHRQFHILLGMLPLNDIKTLIIDMDSSPLQLSQWPYLPWLKTFILNGTREFNDVLIFVLLHAATLTHLTIQTTEEFVATGFTRKYLYPLGHITPLVQNILLLHLSALRSLDLGTNNYNRMLFWRITSISVPLTYIRIVLNTQLHVKLSDCYWDFEFPLPTPNVLPRMNQLHTFTFAKSFQWKLNAEWTFVEILTSANVMPIL
ncbi:unnamed protein product [Rotaria socialis]|uniref:Piwi domain-containing protein n=5 Tax=Rotaria socialis TaxID=392032 RepID=A0A820WHA2_9BILA|nr:unnamed protein product [Rotaria socialis]